MDRWLEQLLEEVKTGLGQVYGDRLHGLYLFGSHARQDADSESDIDLLIVLDEVPDYLSEICRTGELLSSIALRHEISISRVFLEEADWKTGDTPFLHNVRRDAIAA